MTPLNAPSADTPLRLALICDANNVNTQNWVASLRDAGAEVHFISIHPPPIPDSQTHIIQLPGFLKKLSYLAAVPQARSLLQQIQPDVTIAYFATGYGTLGALSGFKPLVIVTAGSDLLVGPKQNRLLRRILRFNFRQAELIVAFAPHMAQAIAELDADQRKIVMQPHGISLSRFGAVRSPEPSPDDVLRIISTRSLKPIYNIEALIDAFSLVSSGDSSLTIAGQGPLRNSLEAHARALTLTARVRFAGFVPNDELPHLLSEHNVYIALTQTEGVSASLLEAMATGLTPIVMDIAANRHWITHGENGLLLPDKQPGTIAAALQRAAEDIDLRQRAWRQNIAIIRERGDQQKCARVYLEHFKRLVR